MNNSQPNWDKTLEGGSKTYIANFAAITSDHSVSMLRLRHSSIEGDMSRDNRQLYWRDPATLEQSPEKRLEYKGGHDGRIR
jgi:hypothetical protein